MQRSGRCSQKNLTILAVNIIYREIDDGEIDESVQALYISIEEGEDYLIFTGLTLATNANPQMLFASKNKTEKLTSNPQYD